MSEHFDDIIRGKLEGQESPVPTDLFSRLQAHPELNEAMFDNRMRHLLQAADTPVSQDLFEKINTAADLGNLSFDTVFKSNLERAESPVPADMWQRIMQEKKRRRPIAIWWWAAAGLLLLLGTGLAYKIWQPTHHPEKILTGTEQETATKSGFSHQPTHPVNPVITDSFTAAQQNGSSSGQPVTSQPAVETEHQADHAPGLNTTTSTTTQHKNKRSSNRKNNLANSTERNSSDRHFVFTATKTHRSSMAEPNITEQEKEEGIVYNSSPYESATIDFATAQLTILQLLRDTHKFEPGKLLKALPHNPVLPCPINGDPARNDWYVDIYSSALLLNKNISDRGNGKNAKSGFDTTLHRQVSFNAGINLVKNIGESFLLKTGIQYNRINEAFRLTRINERRVITTVSIRQVIIGPRDTIYIHDTSTVVQIGTAERRRQNSYTQWDIPVILGYEFGGKNIRLNINAGMIANISTAYSGEIVDTLQQVRDINNISGGPAYRRNVGLSFYAGLSLVKSLGSRTSLLIEPHARFGLGNTTSGTAWFSQKNTLTGLTIGLRYKINKGRQRIY